MSCKVVTYWDGCLHILRNPHGFEEETVRQARVAAADRLEELERDLARSVAYVEGLKRTVETVATYLEGCADPANADDPDNWVLSPAKALRDALAATSVSAPEVREKNGSVTVPGVVMTSPRTVCGTSVGYGESAISTDTSPEINPAPADAAEAFTVPGSRELDAYINATPPLLSLLYDLDLMPEQVEAGSDDWERMATIAEHWQAHEATRDVLRDIDPTDRQDACGLLGLPSGYVAVPATPTAAMLRPLIGCPVEEIFEAWDAMLMIASKIVRAESGVGTAPK